MPQNIDEVNSLHDCIFWIHKEFIEALASVVINSNLGFATMHERVYKTTYYDIFRQVTSIIFSETKENREIEKICIEPLMHLLSKSIPKIVIMENAIITTTKLGAHVCTIEMLEQAEASKGRTLKLHLSDSMTSHNGVFSQGKLKRFWFLAQLLNNIDFAENTSEMKVSIDETTCMLNIEISHIKTKEIILDLFTKLIPLLNSIKDLDIYIYKLILNKNEPKWDFAMLTQKVKNLSSLKNQEEFILLMLLLGYGRSCGRSLPDEFHHIWDNTIYNDYFKLGKKLFFVHMKKLTYNDIENILNKIPIKDKENLLYNLLINNIATIIPFAKTKYNDWFTDKKHGLKLVSFNDSLLQHLDPELHNDVEVVLAAGIQDIENVAYADAKVINNKEFILGIAESITQKYLADKYHLYSIPEKLKNNKRFVLAVIDKMPNIFKCLNNKLKKDLEIALLAVTYDGNNLEYVEKELKKNKSIVLAAVSNNCYALKYASDNLKNDTEILQAYNEDSKE
jgi:hypothetical protein